GDNTMTKQVQYYWLSYAAGLSFAVTNTTIYGDLTAVTSTGYDSQGRAMFWADALGNTVFTQYDSLGQALSLSGATYPVQYAYDSDSRQTELNTTRDGLTWDKTRFLFDGATGLLTNKVYADNSRVSYSYTQSGRPLRTEWAHGVWKEDGYDTIGQLTGTAYSDGTPTASYAYTAAGFLAASSNAMARYQYQNADSGVATNTAVLIGTNAFTVSKALDPFTRLAVLDTDSAQSPVIYGYNAENALASVSNQTFEVAYRFDGARDMGYAITLTNGLTVTRALTRDPHRRHLVTAVSNAVGASAHSLIEYSHNILGNVTNRNGDAFSYNPRSEVSGAVTGTNVFDYAYDGIGNNTVVTVNAAAAVYTANALNQYTAISLPALNPQYDADGNLTAYGDLTLTWDAENRNTAVLSNDVLIVASGYDPQHRRVIKTTSAATRTFLYDGWLPVLEKIILSNGTAEVREHVWGKDLSGTREGAGGVGGLLATRIGDAWYFPLYDANGNITDYVNKSGAVVAHREYGPFGETLAATGPMADDFNFWFSTKYLDHETGLYYYGHRFYSPEFMRWLNRDPIWERDGANVYVFVKNEPVAHTDALGLMGNAPPDSVTKGCCAGKIYNLGTECCCRDKVYSKAAKPSGIRRCCRYNWTGVIPQHCWIEWPGGSAGLYPDANAPLVGLWGSPGIVAVPEPDTSNKQCTQIHLSDCDCNIDAVKACIADVASKHANGSWLSPTYNFGIFDCRHYPGYLVSGCCSAVGCGGSWPSLSTISPW
ncbi:MAG: hypothetical protein PHV28_12215, partial [Kiritimatiellae bacterium]|nr:hypothetical protein [Kiritimatiellia bacterium]